mgnify:CR=1 FL=1|tara:strand:- start:1229 stop:2731 length:1503 start_codon:yes stop_codon:yes gene_type:complete
MADIILINPKSSSLGVFDFLIAKSIPLSIGYLAAYLEERNYNVIIIDEEIETITKEKLPQVTNDKKQLFGISLYTATASRGYHLADLIKSIYPKSTVVLGGIHPTILPEEGLERPSVDLVVRGEGEVIIEEIVVNHHEGKGYQDILSCSYRSNGKIVHNPMAPLIDMDLLPDIPYQMFDSKVYDMGFSISSRGCPYNCSFCSQRVISGNRFRYRSAERVTSELTKLVDSYAPSNIVFLDDIFTINKRRINDLCQTMIEKDLHKKAEYTIVTRADCIDDDLLNTLKSANFTGLGIGVETASNKLMKFINKKETVEEMADGIIRAKQHNFIVDTVFIYGISGETRQDRVDSLNFAKRLDVDKARFNASTPYPGTKFYDVAVQENNLNVIGTWDNFTPTGILAAKNPDSSTLPYYPQGSSADELMMDVIQANMLYYLHYRRMWRFVKNMFDRKGTKWFVLPKGWWKNPKYIKGVYDVIMLNLRRMFWLLKWGLQGKLLTQYKK